MKIRWEEIPADGLFLEITDDSWLPDDGPVCLELSKCAVSLKKEKDRVLLAANLHLVVSLACDRCLEPFAYELAEEFVLFFELTATGQDGNGVNEYFCRADELDVVTLDEPVVDVFSELTQQVYLALPDKKLCDDTCYGLCPECGTNLNYNSCACVSRQGRSPFGALARLKAQ